MESQRLSTQSETAAECRTLDNLLYLLSCEWHIPQEKMAGRRSSMLQQLRTMGERRLRDAVQKCIAGKTSDFCPSTSVIASFAPDAISINDLRQQQHEEELNRLRPIRKSNPDDFFGEADVVCMMRLLKERKDKGLPRLSHDQVIAEVLAIRHACQEKAR